MASPKILYLQYTNPACYPPLEHSSRILAAQGYDVYFFGTGSFAGSKHLKFPEHPKIKLWMIPFCSGGFLQKIHFCVFNLISLLAVLWLRPQWIYLSDPMSCAAGAFLSSLVPGRLIYHEHDSPDPGGSEILSKFQSLIMKWRRKVAVKAQICILPNQKRLENFVQVTGRTKDAFCVWNCPAKEDAAVETDKTGVFSFCFHGSIVPERLPLALIDALARLPEEYDLHICGYETVGSMGYMNKIMETAQKLGVKHRVHYHGVLPMRKDLINIVRKSFVGINLLKADAGDYNLQNMAGASNKPFDYLAGGTAVVVPENKEWERLFVESGYGISCDPKDPENIYQVLSTCASNRDKFLQMGEAGRRRILDEWNYEKQFDVVSKCMAGNN